MLTLIIIFIVCYLFWKWHTRRQPNDPPMLPGAWPFIGHAHMILGDTTNLWKNLKGNIAKFMEIGGASYFYIGPIKIYALTDPDDINKILNTCYEKDQYSYNFTKDLLGDGLLFSPVSIWNRHRRLINPTFNQLILDRYLGIINNQGKKLVKKLEAELGKGNFYSKDYLRLHSMEIICLTTIDDSITEGEALEYVTYVELYMNLVMTRFQRVWLHSNILYQFSNIKKKLDKCIKFLNDKSDSVLRKKRALKKFNIVESDRSQTKVKVFMDLLMDLDNGALSDQEIRNELNTMMMAGQETVATTMEYIFILIGSYPDVQEKIYNELQDVLQDRDVEKQDLPRLVYLEAVIKESLRFCVTVPYIGRYIDREVQLRNCTLKPGCNCAIFLYGIHRNPQWGTDVNNFKPERWLDPSTMPNNPNLVAAFSMGKRNCIGKNYAMISLKVGLSHVLRRYKIHADHTKLLKKLDFVLKPVSGNMISIEDRLKI